MSSLERLQASDDLESKATTAQRRNLRTVVSRHLDQAGKGSFFIFSVNFFRVKLKSPSRASITPPSRCDGAMPCSRVLLGCIRLP